jgi:hypothetical protein
MMNEILNNVESSGGQHMSETTSPADSDNTTGDRRLTEEQKERFTALRGNLLALHSALLDTERASYERVYGQIATQGEFFHLVLTHDWFAHLHALSEMVVQMDEWLDADRPLARRLGRTTAHLPDPDTILTELRTLLTSGSEEHFPRRYRAAIQENSAVVIAHAEVMKALG